MCTAHSKVINDWLRLESTFEAFNVLALDLGINTNIPPWYNLELAALSAIKYVEMFPGLIFVKGGVPENGGGTWLHYDLVVSLAQWCSPAFAIQVNRWVREWLTTKQNPVYSVSHPHSISQA